MASSQAKAGASGSNRSISTKQVHPVTLSSFAPTGCELSTWAYITLPRPSSTAKGQEDSFASKSSPSSSPLAVSLLPNLVTAHANSLKIYVVDPISGTLILASTYDNLAGTITTLDVLPNAAGISSKISGGPGRGSKGIEQSYDGLLIGFAGQPRMSIVYPPGGLDAAAASTGTSADASQWSGVLTASSIIDLTPILVERSLGSVAPLEQDLTCSVTQDGKVPTVAVIMGGGVSIAAFQLPRSNYEGSLADSNAAKDNASSSSPAWWRTASEPYTLPLSNLSASLPATKSKTNSALQQQSKYNKYHAATQTNALKISHGFGDILSSAFLRGYTEPVIVILHSSPQNGGRACPGRLGHHSSATRSALSLTAISISIMQKRSVVLWSLPECMPSDAYELHPHPKGGVLVLGANQVLYVDCAGKVQCCTAVNGWVRATGSSMLLPNVGSAGGLMQPNPSPLSKLSIQLDGSRLSFVNEDVAMVSLRDGTLYSLEFHGKEDCIGVGGESGVCISLSPVGKKLGSLGMISTLSVLPLVHVNIQTHVAMGKLMGKESGFPTAKKEEMGGGDVSKGVALKEEASSLGLVFAGSRMGDSMLMLYDLKEKIKLVPLEKDKEQEQEKAIIDPLESNKRKREDDNEVTVKKERIEQSINEPIDTTKTDCLKNESVQNGGKAIAVSDDENLSEEEIMRREEEALYAPENGIGGANAIIPLQDDGDDRNETLLPGITPKQLYRPQILSMSVFQDTKILDCMTGLGPIGQGCAGPTVGKESGDVALAANIIKPNTKGSMLNIHPCGFGSSGGLALLSAPGLNSSATIVSETDCLDIGSIFPCPNLGYFFVVKKKENSGCMVMRAVTEDEERRLVEVDIDTILEGGMDIETPMPSFESIRDILTRMNIISVKEFKSKNKAASGDFVMLMARYGSAYSLVILSQKQGFFSIEQSHFIGSHDDGKLVERDNLISASFVEHLDKSRILCAGEDLSLACVWSSGIASTFSISYNNDWIIKEVLFDKGLTELKLSGEEVANEDYHASKFYQDTSIVAIDIFAVADNIFGNGNECFGLKVDEETSYTDTRDDEKGHLKFDEDDLELYGEDAIGDVAASSKVDKGERQPADLNTSSQIAPSRYNTLGGYISGAGLSASSKVVVALSRRSGQLEIYDVEKLFEGSPNDSMVHYVSDLKASALLWSSRNGFGQGALILDCSKASYRRPRVQESCASELRFFFSGPSNVASESGDLSVLRSLCLLVETNQGDLHLYTGSKSNSSNDIAFKRVSLHNVARQSKEEGKHRNKLQRKGFAKESFGFDQMFRPNRLHRFFAVSGEDGLFAATVRPQWFVSERGAPATLHHRLRHCAPAGGTDVPICGFCAGFSVDDNNANVGYITVHERVGRVGSQRLTLFSG